MAKCSFAREVQPIRLGAGLRGEGIFVITKALPARGYSQQRPIWRLMEVPADAADVPAERDVPFCSRANEPAAAAIRASGMMNPIRGAVTFNSTSGSCIAAGALSLLDERTAA